MVRRIARSILRSSPADVTFDDLVSAGLVGLLSAMRKTSERRDTFDSFAAVAIRWAMLDWRRTTRTTPRHAHSRGIRVASGVRCDPLSPDPSPEDVAHSQSVLRVLSGLPEREARILAWVYFDEVPGEEIAMRLGISQPRVSQLRSQALARMRERLEAA